MAPLISESCQEEITRNQVTCALSDVTPDTGRGVFGYKIVGDNIDITVNARYMRWERHQNQSLHFFHSFAVHDRINLEGLSTQLAATCNPSPRNMALALLPSTENDTNLLSNIATLISRIIVTHIPLFHFAFSDVTNWHIQHRFYSSMSKKSEVVSVHMNPS